MIADLRIGSVAKKAGVRGVDLLKFLRGSNDSYSDELVLTQAEYDNLSSIYKQLRVRKTGLEALAKSISNISKVLSVGDAFASLQRSSEEVERIQLVFENTDRVQQKFEEAERLNQIVKACYERLYSSSIEDESLYPHFFLYDDNIFSYTDKDTNRSLRRLINRSKAPSTKHSISRSEILFRAIGSTVCHNKLEEDPNMVKLENFELSPCASDFGAARLIKHLNAKRHEKPSKNSTHKNYRPDRFVS